jgi:acetyl esterase/lipase
MRKRPRQSDDDGAMLSAASQRAFLAFLSSLPNWAVHALNNGPKLVAGHVLEPRLRFIEKSLQRAEPESPPSLLAMRRATSEMATVMSGRALEGVLTRQISVSAGIGRTITVRAYERAEARNAGVAVVYAHFGGGVVGDLGTSDWFCRLLALRTGAVILSVDYRLAPEHPFPSGYEDYLAVYRWARYERRSDWPLVGVAGDSIGGCFAAACTVEAVKAGDVAPDFQALVYPVLDLTRPFPSQELFADAFPMSSNTAQWFMAQYLPAGTDLLDHRVSPGLYAADASRVQTLLVAAGHDVLVDQAVWFRDKLSQHGAAVDWLLFHDLCHGFTSMSGVSRRIESACETIASGIAAMVRRCAPANFSVSP